MIRAAGGIVVRDGRVLVVHRPEHDDWSLPKGKLDEGESWEDAAVRELAEETGLRCTIEGDAGTTRYVDADGRDKEVRWFRVATADEPLARNEVDEVRWVALGDDADALLTHESDRELLRGLG